MKEGKSKGEEIKNMKRMREDAREEGDGARLRDVLMEELKAKVRGKRLLARPSGRGKGRL